MKKVLIVSFIVLIISIMGFNGVGIDISNSSNNELEYRVNELPNAKKNQIDPKLDGKDLMSINDNNWLLYSKDFNDNDQKFKVLFDLPKIVKSEEYTDIYVSGCEYTAAGGAPLLPYRAITYNFPPGSHINAIYFQPGAIKNSDVPKPIRPEPEHEPIYDDPIFKNQFEHPPQIDPGIYYNDQLYPASWHSYSTGLGLSPLTNNRELFLVIHIYPVKYNPVQNQVQYITSGTLELSVSTPEADHSTSGASSSTESSQTRSNTDGGSENTDSRAVTHDMVIITPDIFKSHLSDFSMHKTATGIDTIIITMGDIVGSKFFSVSGRDNAEKIKYFIYNAVKDWDIKYVLLIGDVEKLPTRITHVEDSVGDNEASDLYFADVLNSANNFCDWDYDCDDRFGEYQSSNIDKADLYPDVHIGRLPVSNTNELDAMIKKIKNYEIDTIGQTWFKTAVLCGLDTFPGGTAEGEYLSDQIASKYLQDFNVIKLYDSTNTLTKSNIRTNWNNGAGFVSFSDHGLHSSWGGKFSSSDVSALTNSKKAAFVNYDACLCGEFDQGSDCMAEETILNSDAGGVAVVASSRIAYGSFGRSHVNSASGYLNLRLYHNYEHTTEVAGALLTWAKTDYIRNVGAGGSTNFKTLVEYNYFGDPSLLLGGLPTAIYNLECKNNVTYIDPGETAEYCIQVENTDIQTRQIKLSTDSIPTKWSVKLSKSSITLQPNSMDNITLTVTSPADGYANFEANIKVIAALTNSERTIAIFTKTKINRIYGLDILSNDKPNATVSVYPNRAINVTFKVYNHGNGEDQISLKLISNQESTYDWEYEFFDSKVTLEPFSNEVVKLQVDVPHKTIATNYSFFIRGTLLGNSQTHNFDLTISVLRIYGMNISCDNINLSSDPGRNITYKLYLENKGNHLEYFELYVSDLGLDWQTWFKTSAGINDTIPVEPFSIKEVKCIIGLPTGTLVGLYELTLVGRCIGMEYDVFKKLDLNLNVNRVYGISLSTLAPEINIDPGETYNFYLEVKNLGNDIDYADLEVIGQPEGWYVDFDYHDSVRLMANGKRLYGTIIVPNEKTTVGSYNIYFRANLAGDGSYSEIKQVVNISRIYNLSISTVDGMKTIQAGSETELSIKVTNLGNDADSVTLSLPKQLPDSTLELLTSDSISLSAFGDKEVTAKLEVDKFATAGIHSIPITGRLESINQNYSFNIDFYINKIHGIELEVSNGNIKTKPGDEVRFDVSIINSGNSKENFTFEISGLPTEWRPKFPIEQTLMLEPYSTTNQSFSIMIPSDEEYHDVVIDLRIQSQEHSRTNFISKVKISLVEDKPELFGMSPDSFTNVLGIIIIIIILLTLGIYVVRKRKKIEKSTTYEYTRSSDGSRVDWEQPSKPLPVQYNPPTPAATTGQPFEIQIQSPHTYRGQTDFINPIQYDTQTPNSTPNQIQDQTQTQVPPYTQPQAMSFQNDPLLPPHDDLEFKAPELYSTPSVQVPEASESLIELDKDKDSGQEPDMRTAPVYHDEEEVSLNYKLPVSRTSKSISTSDTDSNSNISSIKPSSEDKVQGPDGEDVELFKVKDDLVWKRPKRLEKDGAK